MGADVQRHSNRSRLERVSPVDQCVLAAFTAYAAEKKEAEMLTPARRQGRSKLLSAGALSCKVLTPGKSAAEGSPTSPNKQQFLEVHKLLGKNRSVELCRQQAYFLQQQRRRATARLCMERRWTGSPRNIRPGCRRV